MTTLDQQITLNYLRIALQSALASALCLGLPAGLLLWLILIRENTHAPLIEQSLTLMQSNGLNKIFVLAFCSLLWSFLLSRISGYRPWWKIGLATALGIILGWFSPLSNMDAWFGEHTPIHIVYAVAMCGIVGSATLGVGLAYGLILRNGKAALTLALSTSLVSIITVLLTVILFDQLGIRVGTGNFAMSRVTVISLLMSAITGGMVLGLFFSRFVADRDKAALQSMENK